MKTMHPDPQQHAPMFRDHDFHKKEWQVDNCRFGRCSLASGTSGVNVQGRMKLSDIWIDADKASTPNAGPKIDSTTKSDWKTEPWARITPDKSI